MKALTLHQPWASAIALGLKTVETRSWRTDYRGPLAIHAGLTIPPYNDHGVPVSLVPRPGGVVGHFGGIAHPLPLGAIVATCCLVDVMPIVAEKEWALPMQEHPTLVLTAKRPPNFLSTAPYPEMVVFRDPLNADGENIEDQRPWGDFTPGRWAWLLDDVKPTTERCPACWGIGNTGTQVPDPDAGREGGVMWDVMCPVCDGATRCDPVPAKGARGLWEWTP